MLCQNLPLLLNSILQFYLSLPVCICLIVCFSIRSLKLHAKLILLSNTEIPTHTSESNHSLATLLSNLHILTNDIALSHVLLLGRRVHGDSLQADRRVGDICVPGPQPSPLQDHQRHPLWHPARL